MKDEINMDGVVYVKKEIVKNKEWHKANSKYFLEHNNDDWEYTDVDDVAHLIRDSEEIAKGKCVYSFPNGDWAYKNNKNIEYLCRIIDNYVWERKNKI